MIPRPGGPTRSSIYVSQDRFGSWSTDTVLTEVAIDPIPVTPAIPEPSTWLLLSGVAALGARQWRCTSAPAEPVQG